MTPIDSAEPAAPDAAQENFFEELRVEFLIHELKDPIAVIETGMRTLLERRDKCGPLTPRQEKTLMRSLRNARKAREMLHGLLEVGRSQAACFDCCAFRPARVLLEVVGDALETQAGGDLTDRFRQCREEAEALACLASEGITIDIQAEAGRCEMLQDETKFRQITGNLLKNALHHRSRRLRVRLQQEQGRLVTEVSDDGPGIRPEHHELIFRRYARVRDDGAAPRKGHGLGLAGALALARGLGGDIELRSRRGKGATFRLVLPTVFTAPRPAETPGRRGGRSHD